MEETEDEIETVELAAIATAAFRGSREADEIGEKLMLLLGLHAHYLPARLALALSLRNPATPERYEGEVGRAIRGQNLFGEEAAIAAWVSLIVEHEGRRLENLQDLHRRVRDHWARGARRLGEILDRVGRDEFEFWRQIAELLPEQREMVKPIAEERPVREGIPIGPVAQDVENGERVVFVPSAQGASPHAAIVGGVGSGKTRTAVFMLGQLRQQTQVPLITFDFKGDIVDSELQSAFGCKVIEVPKEAVPLDILAVDRGDESAVALAAQRLRDSLTTLHKGQFGPQQRDLLATAIEEALRRCHPCRLSDIRDQLNQLYEQVGRAFDGATATLNDLCRLPLFEPELAPAEFFGQSWIIRLRQDLPDVLRAVVVTLVTDALDRWLNSLADAIVDPQGYRALRVIAMIDEAHRVLGQRLPGLSNLVRLSRSKGGMIWLISQSPDDFRGEDDDFFAETGLVVAFATHADPGPTRRILGRQAALTELSPGQAWVRIRGEPARRVQVWQPSEASLALGGSRG